MTLSLKSALMFSSGQNVIACSWRTVCSKSQSLLVEQQGNMVGSQLMRWGPENLGVAEILRGTGGAANFGVNEVLVEPMKRRGRPSGLAWPMQRRGGRNVAEPMQ